MASPGSFTRSAARATSSAYRRLPIRWRLAGGSALLTLVILLGFASIVGVLTTRSIQSDFDREVAEAADELRKTVKPQLVLDEDGNVRDIRLSKDSTKLDDFAASQNAVIRVTFEMGEPIASTTGAPYLPPPRAAIQEYNGYRIESRQIPVGTGALYVQYARKLSYVEARANRMRLFLGLGVLGGAALALLAGLATATRAMAPIARLTDTARAIARTRDPSLTIPHPESRDEVSELALTLESMLHSLTEARSETEATLARQRQFVADASHELRTPLTSVLANLELLEMELEGEAREAAASALRSSRRMRRLVADLLLLARADAGRVAAHEPVDLSDIVTEAAGELEPVAGDHQISVAADPARRWRARATSCTASRSTCWRTRCATRILAPPSRPPWSGSTARSSCQSRTTALASRPSCATRCSSASSAARATGAARAGSASRSCARSRSHTTARSRWWSRSTAAAPASWCGSPRAADATPERALAAAALDVPACSISLTISSPSTAAAIRWGRSRAKSSTIPADQMDAGQYETPQSPHHPSSDRWTATFSSDARTVPNDEPETGNLGRHTGLRGLPPVYRQSAKSL